ncbi:hypothetical protein Tsubulata_000381 [Turnera subulata]|uniref:Endonuclease/exonuclease/phosphatase domain-containing protein n=1 Tax=Turnera subulata TaxID=218843 RepID=A0A9Q0F102_9ROSI|nr:hypothetical protein Tsubulata_000381 [Turnera subulata]
MVSWNIRGLGSLSKHRLLNELIHHNDAKIVFICETKLQGVDRHFCSRLWNSRDLEFRSVDADGLSGGLLLLWDESTFHVSQCNMNRNWILVEGSYGTMAHKLTICCVYGDNQIENRLAMWAELRNLKQSFTSPWLLIGDLNQTLSPEDRKSRSFSRKGAGALRSFTEALQLGEFPLMGRNFTWANSLNASRIDRAFAQPEWSLWFKSLKLQAGKRGLSDHWPLILAQDKIDWGFKPFRFMDCWWQTPKFMDTLQELWRKAGETHQGIMEVLDLE